MEVFFLFILSFLGATILPFSSEVAFLVALENKMPQYTALLFASFGNILGIVLNYYLGLFLYEKTKTKLTASRVGKKALSLGRKYGYYTLILSWLPIIGDPLTLVSGLLRLHFFWFFLIAGFLRIARYYFLMFMI